MKKQRSAASATMPRPPVRTVRTVRARLQRILGLPPLAAREDGEKSEKSEGQKMNVSKEIRMKQGLEHNTSTENDGEDGDRFENSSKTGIERTEKSARASNESKA